MDPTRSYKLKLYPNAKKRTELNKLFAFWRDHVNHKIKVFWNLNAPNSYYPPKEYTLGGRLVRDASVEAWRIVKVARKRKTTERPQYTGNCVMLNQTSAHIISDCKTAEFDIWFNVISLNKYQRLKLPSKKTGIFNVALLKGVLKKSFRLEKVDDDYYISCSVDLPSKDCVHSDLTGIDVGIDNAIVTSDGKIMGTEVKSIGIRTKWRSYKNKVTPTKQSLNHYAKELVAMYPSSNFAVETLSFTGKRNRSKLFRSRNNRWAYNHISNRLTELGRLEGFRVIKVNPAYSSQECPACGFTDRANRQGTSFLCGQCGYGNHADVVGAINLVGRVAGEHSVPLKQHQEVV